jgi:hypothetical protein
MKRTTLSTALYVSLVFLSGGVVGGFVHRLYMMNTVIAGPVTTPKPDDYRKKYLEEMRTRLSLNQEQLSQLSTILDSTETRVHEVKAKWNSEARTKAKPELKAIQEDQIQKVKGILTEPQQVEYDKLRAEREKRRQQSMNDKAAAAPGK